MVRAYSPSPRVCMFPRSNPEDCQKTTDHSQHVNLRMLFQRMISRLFNENSSADDTRLRVYVLAFGYFMPVFQFGSSHTFG